MNVNSAFVIVPTYRRFEGIVAKIKPVLLSAYGAGCSICMSAAAEAAIAASYGASVTLVKMSVDSVPELEGKLAIDTIPTLLLFQEGRPRRKFPSNPDANGANVLSWLAGELVGAVTPGPMIHPKRSSPGHRMPIVMKREVPVASSDE